MREILRTPTQLQAAEQSPQLMAAFTVQQYVRDQLVFTPQSRLAELDEPYLTREADCLGYAVQGSRQLDKHGVVHGVGFVNGHATTVVPVGEGRESTVWLTDMLSPQLTQDLESATLYRSTEELAPQLRAEPKSRQLLLVNGVQIAEAAGREFAYARGKYPWLALNDSGFNPRTHLVMSVFASEHGRQTLCQYDGFRAALDNADDQAAANSIINMGASFPDMDIRGSAPSTVKQLAKRLAKTDPELALETIEQFFSAFSQSSDTRIGEKKADCIKEVARVVRASESFGGLALQLLREARELYGGIVDNPRSYSSSIAGKMRRCEDLIIEAESAEPVSAF